MAISIPERFKENNGFKIVKKPEIGREIKVDVRALSNKCLVVFALLLVTISGCQTTGSKADQRLTKSESAKFFTKSGTTACVGGAAISGAACLLLGGDEKKCAALAAAACVAGFAADKYLDKKRQEYADAEDRVDAMIADVRKDNQELKSLTKISQTVLNEDKKKLREIQNSIDSDELQKSQAKKELASIDANTAYLRDTLKNLHERQKEWQEIANSERKSGSDVEDLDAEINSMKNQIAQLELEVDQLYEQRSSIQLT
jgi:uncharacterized protein YgiM (DUF1202 family)